MCDSLLHVAGSPFLDEAREGLAEMLDQMCAGGEDNVFTEEVLAKLSALDDLDESDQPTPSLEQVPPPPLPPPPSTPTPAPSMPTPAGYIIYVHLHVGAWSTFDTYKHDVSIS